MKSKCKNAKKEAKTLKLLKKGQEWRHTSWKNVENCLFESWHIKKPQLVNVSAKEFSIKTCLIYPLLLGKGVKPDIGNFPLSSLSMAESFYYLELEKTYRKDLNATFGNLKNSQSYSLHIGIQNRAQDIITTVTTEIILRKGIIEKLWQLN